MMLMKKAHIGEVQASTWPREMIEACEEDTKAVKLTQLEIKADEGDITATGINMNLGQLKSYITIAGIKKHIIKCLISQNLANIIRLFLTLLHSTSRN